MHTLTHDAFDKGVCWFLGMSEKQSDHHVCDEYSCSFGGICRDNGSHLECLCQFQVCSCSATMSSAHYEIKHGLLLLMMLRTVYRLLPCDIIHVWDRFQDSGVCFFQCPQMFAPVCGSDGDTYHSECFLRQAACEQQTRITVITEGHCNPG